MEKIVCLSLLVGCIIFLKIILKVSYKNAKKLEKNQSLEKITDKFPENIQLAREMLTILKNENVKLEEAKNTKSSFYLVITNKIIIADMKNSYARIQTIAHECMHSIQDKTLLIFNFVFSNFTLAYWIIASILTICNVIKNTSLQMFILLLVFFIQTIIRAYLETDAMIKSKFLAKEYIENKNICTKEEVNRLILEYKKINNIGIPFYIYWLITSTLIKIIVYIIISTFC